MECKITPEPRPSGRCTSPRCAYTPERDGECWTCPRCMAALRAEVARLTRTVDSAASERENDRAELAALEQERDALRESAARLEMVRQWFENEPYEEPWVLARILDGTTPIPPELLRGSK